MNWRGRASDLDENQTKVWPTPKGALEQRFSTRGVPHWAKWSGSTSPQRSVTGWGYPGKACPKGAAIGGCHLTSLLADKVSSLLNRGLNGTPPCWPHYLMGL